MAMYLLVSELLYKIVSIFGLSFLQQQHALLITRCVEQHVLAPCIFQHTCTCNCSINAHVVVYQRPCSATVLPIRQLMTENLHCAISGASPKALLQWDLSAILIGHCTPSAGLSTSHVICVKKSAQKWSQSVRCVGSNGVNRASRGSVLRPRRWVLPRRAFIEDVMDSQPDVFLPFTVSRPVLQCEITVTGLS